MSRRHSTNQLALDLDLLFLPHCSTMKQKMKKQKALETRAKFLFKKNQPLLDWPVKKKIRQYHNQLDTNYHLQSYIPIFCLF